jgi:2-polyprenyl-3-methyl-5-hydroxy-6-metoxy-1,4-benzoquinol methylase
MNEAAAINRLRDFQQQYLSLRRTEGRIFTDNQVSRLPDLPKKHPLQKEWNQRARTAAKFYAYLSGINKKISLLEVGCGNGWFSNYLAKNNQIQVTGMDINLEELDQARRVFKKSNLAFRYGTFENDNTLLHGFDIILFAASIQYFPSVINVIKASLHHLNPDGEIHILDSHFYNVKEKPAAIERSQQYFNKMAAPLMHSYYFHHCIEDLQAFKYKTLNIWQLQIEKITGSKQSFPWICIKKQPC